MKNGLRLIVIVLKTAGSSMKLETCHLNFSPSCSASCRSVSSRQSAVRTQRESMFALLYYRLNVFPIYLPSLRERKADIPELVEYFVQQFAASMDKSIESIPQETMRSLVRHYWPGNIRELQNYIARGVILSNDGVFEPAPLERAISHWNPRFQTPPSKTRYVEKFWLLASALIGSSEIREGQLQDLACSAPHCFTT